MGPASGPTQACGSADLHDESGYGPLSVGSGVRTQIAWVRTRTKHPWVRTRTQLPTPLGLDTKGPNPFGSGYGRTQPPTLLV
jgi:hypothetical protein